MVVRELRALWRYREFLLGSIRKDIALRFKGSLFGMAWLIIPPVFMIGMYTIVFSSVMKARLPGVAGEFGYSLYLCAGIVLWSFFADSVQRMSMVFIENANLIKKSSFPILSLPLIVIGSGTFNFLVTLLVLAGLLFITGNWPGSAWVGMIPIVLLLMTLTGFLGLFIAIFNVFFRDVGQFIGMFLQLAFWCTPIVYPAETLPPWARELLSFNPLAHLVHASQSIIVYGKFPDFSQWLCPLSWMLVLGGFALLSYQKLRGYILDEL